MFNKTRIFIVIIILLVLVEVLFYSTKAYRRNHEASIDNEAIEEFEKKHNYSFSGEKIPIYSQRILEKFEKEVRKNARWHKEIVQSYKRSGKYFPVIEPILKQYGIPDDFKYLTVVESGLDNKTSPRGAAGIWQFMPHTAREYGLQVSEHIDERYDLAKSTRAACKFFKQSYKKFKSWTLVAASYNLGINGLRRKIRKQDADSYYDLRLNSETARYVYRVIAVKDILSNPSHYHFKLKPHHKYAPVPSKKIKVEDEIPDLTIWANNHGIDEKVLKIFNPWLRSNQLPNPDKKRYFIEIPTGKISLASSGNNLDLEKKKDNVPQSSSNDNVEKTN